MGWLPEEYTVFQCFGWLCDENDTVYTLSTGNLDYGRRQVECLDADYARELILNTSDFLVDQVQEDGSFVYGMYPWFDNDIENYNIVRHASTLWSLVCRYRMEPNEELAEIIDRTIGYMLTQVIYENEDTAHLYEEKDDEIKLGGTGVAVIALTEYMNVFQSDKYVGVCRKLGNGILTMMDQENETYYHVLNGYFFPEYAMYMENPQRVLDTFMVRHDGYRIRIDDVQHNIGGYYMYYKHYDKLVEYGMLDPLA